MGPLLDARAGGQAANALRIRADCEDSAVQRVSSLAMPLEIRL